jgi:hypothetical protein
MQNVSVGDQSPVTRTVTRDRETGIVDTIAYSAPLDRVRWASVLAGLFTVLASLATFALLGIATSLSTFDAQQAQNFGAGAGLYGAIAALVSFGLGGFIAGRTAAVAGQGNALLNGAMVWIVTVVVVVNILGSGIGTLIGTAGNVATAALGAAAEVAAPLVDDAANAAANPAVQPTAEAGAEAIATQAGAAAQDLQAQVAQIDAQDVEQIARDASVTAWRVLAVFGLTALAALLGGMAGTRLLPTDVAVMKNDIPRNTYPRDN